MPFDPEDFAEKQKCLPPEFSETVDRHFWDLLADIKYFKFWVCPDGCRDFVDWNGDRATCRKCGTDNHANSADQKTAQPLNSNVIW